MHVLDETLQEVWVKNQVLGIWWEQVTLPLDELPHQSGGLRYVYVACAVWVEVLPNINESLQLVVRYPTIILLLHIVKSLKGYRNKQVNKDQTDRKNI